MDPDNSTTVEINTGENEILNEIVTRENERELVQDDEDAVRE